MASVAKVERGETVVEDVDIRVASDRAGDREALFLTAGDVRTALRDRVLVSLLEPLR